MLDLSRVRKEPRTVEALLRRRGCDVNFDELLTWDARRRALGAEGDALKAQRNMLSAQVPQLRKAGEDTEPLFEQVRRIGESIKAIDADAEDLSQRIFDFVAALPNLPDADVPAGGKDKNEVLHVWGEKPVFAFPIASHMDLARNLTLIDYARGAKLGGAGKWIYTGEGAKLEWALINYFIQAHTQDGYRFMLVPHILNYESGFTAGQFPKFTEDVFWVGRQDDHVDQFLLPTAETALVNLHRDEILPEEELPKKYVCYSPCYRYEAGSYRAEERGMIRGNQFNKVELVIYAKPQDSHVSFDELVDKAERLVQGLGLHYRLSKLAAGDCSASMARTYDVEVWIPSMGIYKEASSISSANDYQARRGSIRYRQQENGKTEYVHTLNASALATSRIFPAILEQFQMPDGSIAIPKVLIPWVGKEIITKNE